MFNSITLYHATAVKAAIAMKVAFWNGIACPVVPSSCCELMLAIFHGTRRVGCEMSMLALIEEEVKIHEAAIPVRPAPAPTHLPE